MEELHAPRPQPVEINQLFLAFCSWSGTLSNLMKELTHHLCKRLVAEHYASINARTGSDSGAVIGLSGTAFVSKVGCGAWGGGAAVRGHQRPHRQRCRWASPREPLLVCLWPCAGASRLHAPAARSFARPCAALPQTPRTWLRLGWRTRPTTVRLTHSALLPASAVTAWPARTTRPGRACCRRAGHAGRRPCARSTAACALVGAPWLQAAPPTATAPPPCWRRCAHSRLWRAARTRAARTRRWQGLLQVGAVPAGCWPNVGASWAHAGAGCMWVLGGGQDGGTEAPLPLPAARGLGRAARSHCAPSRTVAAGARAAARRHMGLELGTALVPHSPLPGASPSLPLPPTCAQRGPGRRRGGTWGLSCAARWPRCCCAWRARRSLPRRACCGAVSALALFPCGGRAAAAPRRQALALVCPGGSVCCSRLDVRAARPPRRSGPVGTACARPPPSSRSARNSRTSPRRRARAARARVAHWPPPTKHPSVPGTVAAAVQDKGSARVASQVLAALAHLAPDLVLVSRL